MRRPAVIAAVLVTLAAVAYGTAASGQSGPTTRVVALDVQDVGGFFPKRLKAGSRVGVVQRITGDDSGRGYVTCTVMDRHEHVLCAGTMKLEGGDIALQAAFDLKKERSRGVVSGGTGGYDGARGTARSRSVAENRSELTLTLVQ